FQLRQPLFEPRGGTLSEAEIHARLIEALGELGERQYRTLRAAARLGMGPFAIAFAWKSRRDKAVARYASVVLYRTLGANLSASLAPAASLWGISQLFVRKQSKAAAGAGFGGGPTGAGNRLFQAILGSPSGVVFAVSDYTDSWTAVRQAGHKVNLFLAELMPELAKLDTEGPRAGGVDGDHPFVLSAGERRSDTSNTSIRDLTWHRKGTYGTLRIGEVDALTLALTEGDWVRLVTRRGSATAQVEITANMQPGHVSLPNGQGLDVCDGAGPAERRGVALNELTSSADQDPIAGTPWHKYVPVRIERLGPQSATE
ncbi:MAG: molybdopterin dinucleotide binding domain-containing protein, partial [Usitatibacteraceae bacterium]